MFVQSAAKLLTRFEVETSLLMGRDAKKKKSVMCESISGLVMFVDLMLD